MKKMQRDYFGALLDLPKWVSRLLQEIETKTGAWETGIESDRKQRGESINTSVYSYCSKRKLAVVQVRYCRFAPGRFNRVRKNYFLVGYNENGNPFAHAVDSVARSKRAMRTLQGGVSLALSWIWECKEDEVDSVVRNGDVAFVPVAALPEGAEPVAENETVIRESHHVKALGDGRLYRAGSSMFVVGRASIEHSKGQHAVAEVDEGVWRVQAGWHGSIWGFSKPTAD